MTDLDKFQEAVAQEQAYAGSLSASMALVLEEFYSTLRTVGMSAVTGEGTEDLFAAIADAAEEYHRVYRPMMEKRALEKNQRQEAAARRRVEKVRAQVNDCTLLHLILVFYKVATGRKAAR